MNVFNLSQDDFKDFSSPSKKLKRKKRKLQHKVSDKTKVLSENHSTDQKSTKPLQSKCLNSKKPDINYPCSTCGKSFGVLELFDHAPKCLKLNTTVAADPHFSNQSKVCPVCNKTFKDLSENQLNWHINKCIDKQKIKEVLPSFTSETVEKKKVQSTVLNSKYFKIPKSKFAQDMLTAKALSASENQLKKDKLKRNKLSKKDKIPSMIQYSPESLNISKEVVIQEIILSKAFKKRSVKDNTFLPPYKTILLNKSFLTLSLSCQVKDIQNINLICKTELEELYKVI